MWARPELLLREGRLAPEDDRRPEDEAREGRLLGRLERLDARDRLDGATLRRVDDREPLRAAPLDGRGEVRLGLTDRPLLLREGRPEVPGRAELRDGRAELRLDGFVNGRELWRDWASCTRRIAARAASDDLARDESPRLS